MAGTTWKNTHKGSHVMHAVAVNCPNCGAPASINGRECVYCHFPILVTSFIGVGGMDVVALNKHIAVYRSALKTAHADGRLNLALAFCYLQLKMYDKALPAFEKAIEDDFGNSEAFFYTAVCLLGGKKAFLAKREVINKIEEYINAARAIENRGIYAYFHAYVKYDYFERKCLITEPDYTALLDEARRLGVTEHDIGVLYGLLNTDRPHEL